MKNKSIKITILFLLFGINSGFAQIKITPQTTRLLNWIDTSGIGIDSIGYWDEHTIIKTKYYNNFLTESNNINSKTNDTSSRTTYLYDNSNRLLEVVNYSGQLNTPTNRKLKKSMMTTYSYPDNLGSNESTSYTFDTLSKTWNPTYRRKYIFDEYGNPILGKEEFVQNGVWIESTNYKRSYTYLPNTNLFTQRIDSGFDTFTQKYLALVSYTRKYDINWNLSQITVSRFNNQKWDLYYKNIFQYVNGINNQLYIIQYLGGDSSTYRYENIKWKSTIPKFDILTSNMISNCLSDYTEVNEYLSTSTKSKVIKTIFTDLFGSYELYSKVYSLSDSDEYKDIKLYNNYKDLLLTESYKKQSNNSWSRTFGMKYDYKYTNNVLYETIKFSLNQDKYLFNSKEIYEDFISIQLGIDINRLKVTIYPNPSSDGTTYIKYDSQKENTLEIDVLDLNGKTIVTQNFKTIEGLNTLELNGLNKGVYFVVITSEDRVSTSKLIVN